MTTVLALVISVMVLTTLILMVTSQAAFAQMGVNTILEKYYPGETIIVYGSIDRIVPQIRIQVVDPGGQLLDRIPGAD